jgi:hypothetical protein
MKMDIKIPKGTEAEINGIPVTFNKDTEVDFPCESVDHAAEKYQLNATNYVYQIF